MEPVESNNTPHNVEIRHNKRARRYRITIRHNGKVMLTIPANGTIHEGLRFVHHKNEWIQKALIKTTSLPPLHEDIDIRSLKAEALKYLPDRLAWLAETHRLSYTGCQIRNMSSRWGSCSARNKINLNLHLIRLPRHLSDFVMLHELAHTLHKNHGPLFYQLLDRLSAGQTKLLSKELKNHHPD